MPEAPQASPASVQLLVLDCVNAASNMARYYVLSVEQTLFGDAALVREWGRIGVSCRRRIDLYEHDAAVKTALSTWLKRKSRRGYKLRPDPTDAPPMR